MSQKNHICSPEEPVIPPFLTPQPKVVLLGYGCGDCPIPKYNQLIKLFKLRFLYVLISLCNAL